MHDQADELRQRFRSMQAHKPLRQTKIVAVSGGCPDVGTTTVAVNIAVALAQQGRRIVLVDADERAADATALCELDNVHGSLQSVIAEGRSIHEVLERGPAGVLVLPGSPVADRASAVDHQLLVQQCQGLDLYADAVLVDLGSRTDELAKYLWQAADMVAVVTTPEVQTVMDTYAVMKALTSNDSSRLVHTIINHAAGSEIAQQIHGRLTETSRRFLGMPTRMAGFVPYEAELVRSAVQAHPILLQSPRSPAARALDRLAETLWVILLSSSSWLDQRGAASEDFAPAAGYGPLAA